MEQVTRAFNRVYGSVNHVQSRIPAVEPLTSEHSETEKQPGTELAGQAIKRILQCWKDKEYFKLIQLPDPIADELGRPVWPCSSLDVSRAYRKLSVLVHPDKNPGEEARAAFEALNEAHRMLKDAGRLEEVLRDVAGRVRRDRERAEAGVAGLAQRVELNASKNSAVKALRKQEGQAFQETILQQARKRKEDIERRAHALAHAKASQLHAAEAQQSQAGLKRGEGERPQEGMASMDEDGNAQEDSDDDGKLRRRQALAARKRRKPTILN
ncbi:hypothetical protein QJQ45_019768 [Haematococcus lacustris]|nr:hypothetical protein QJQ45_019768 [Haematococcus lacustris]